MKWWRDGLFLEITQIVFFSFVGYFRGGCEWAGKGGRVVILLGCDMGCPRVCCWWSSFGLYIYEKGFPR